QQTALLGLNHYDFMTWLIKTKLHDWQPVWVNDSSERIVVVLGGATSERQVSRQSGVFAGLCLQSRGYDIQFVLMVRDNSFTPIGLFLALQHEIEEIESLIAHPVELENVRMISHKIAIDAFGEVKDTKTLDVGSSVEFSTLLRESPGFIFDALHGGAGE